MQLPLEISVVLFGNKKSGKTSLLNRIVESNYSSEYIPTKGVNYKTKNDFSEKLTINYKEIPISEDEHETRKQHLLGAQQILLVFNPLSDDVVNLLSENLKVIKKANPLANITVVATHYDQSKDQISNEKARLFARENKIAYIEVSSKDGNNINIVEERIKKSAQIFSKKLFQTFNELKSRSVEEEDETANQSMSKILDLIGLYSGKENSRLFINDRSKELNIELSKLQRSSTSKSVQNFLTTLAIIAVGFTIIGYPWMRRTMLDNEIKRGNPFLFWTDGNKQKAEELIHQAKIAPEFKK